MYVRFTYKHSLLTNNKICLHRICVGIVKVCDHHQVIMYVVNIFKKKAIDLIRDYIDLYVPYSCFIPFEYDFGALVFMEKKERKKYIIFILSY